MASGVGHSRKVVTLYSWGLAANLNGFTSGSKLGKSAVVFMAIFHFRLLFCRRESSLHTFRAGLGNRASEMRRMGAATPVAHDSSGNQAAPKSAATPARASRGTEPKPI